MMTSIGLVIGLLLGGIITHVYDRKGFHRIPGAVEMAIADGTPSRNTRRAARRSAAELRPRAAGRGPNESSSEQT